MIRFSPHNHTEMSNFRLLDCINKLPNLIERGKEIGLAGMAITDHETIAQSIRICKLQKENPDFKIAIGNEIYLTDTRDKNQKYYHYILIAKDAEGHKQLRQLSSIAWMNSYWDRGMERVPTLKEDLWNIVSQNPGHLIATSACIGGELGSSILNLELARKISDHNGEIVAYNQICSFIEWNKRLFGPDFYIEIAPAASKDQITVNKKLVQIAQNFGNIKLVIGDDSHYLTKEDRYIHKAYLNSKGGERETDLFYEYSYLQDEDDIRKNLEPSEIDVDICCQNSMEMFDKIEVYDLLHSQTIPMVPVKNYHHTEWLTDQVEEFPIITELFDSDDIYERYWINECFNKLDELNLRKKEYLDELEEEARVKRIIGEKLNTNMFKYPITLQYYIDMMWDCGSLVGAGRGSSCAALNHYLLGITQLDPIEWDLPFFRYMNDERVELGDIDIDICPSKKGAIVKKIKEERGSRFIPELDELSRSNLGCTLIATYGTEGTKSAILTACRGYRSLDYTDGIDNDEAQYIASLVPSERGFLWSIDDVVNGNLEKGRHPVQMFVNEVEQYPGLLDIIKGIEGLVNKRSSHASGVILFDEDPYEFGCFMRTPKGEIITQYDLHDCEAAGLTKYDFLVTEVQDKLAQAIKFLQEDGCIEKDMSLREVYNKYFHPNVLPLDRQEVWDAIRDGSVINIFQFDSQVGSQAAKKINPQTILEMADANGLMRLMTAEQGAETPMEKYIRFKDNIKLWYNEMERYGLSINEQKVLEPYFLKSYGVPPSQEQLMTMLMDKDICDFSLAEANAARKIVGKKQMNKIPQLRESIMEKAKSAALGRYVWDCGVGPQMGYSFSIIHALAYSFIGFQTAYIATNWNPIYWDTACLVINSGSLEEDDNEYDEDGVPTNKRETGTDYGKVARALGEIISAGIKVSLVDINKSDYGFKPDVANNQILFGMKALSYVGADVIDKIKSGRPYSSLKDFMERCKLNKTAMINLIKAGAFDNLESEWAKEVNQSPRILAMVYYLSIVSEPKKRLTLQNLNGLINNNLFPEELNFEKEVFYFNKFLKKNKFETFYVLKNQKEIEFFYDNFGADYIAKVQGDYHFIEQKVWDNLYSSIMDKVRDYLKTHQEEMLRAYNTLLFKEQWDKYAKGNESAWEMESLCFYYHDHELKGIDNQKYGIQNFFKLSSTPEVDYFFKRNGKQIPIYKLCRIAGTVIGKNDTRHLVTLLTVNGVVNVKFTRDYYAMFNRQLSEINEDGTKSVKEKGWFTRGVKLLVTGYRRDDTFVSKKYKATGGHQLYKITDVEGRNINITSERYGVENAEEI